jgi:hypothetical protein
MELHDIWKVKKTVIKSVHCVTRYAIRSLVSLLQPLDMHNVSKLVKSFRNTQVEIINWALPQISIYGLNVITNN